MDNNKTINDTEKEISQICDELANMLIGKNRAYGDSALQPKRIFSRSDSVEQIRVRIDDKLSRLQNMKGDVDQMGEDPEWDLMGYLVLLKIAKRRRMIHPIDAAAAERKTGQATLCSP